MPATVFATNKVKTLKNALTLNGNVDFVWVSADPTVTPVDAPEGSIVVYGNNIYRKIDNGSTTNVDAITLNSDIAPPVGTIVAWQGGYYTAAANVGFTDVLGNTVANVNTYLPSSWRVCDGTALNDASSPIFNAAGRFLPDLTDSRFIQGSTSAGGTGGSSTWNKTELNTNQTSHSHVLSSNGQAQIYTTSGDEIFMRRIATAGTWTYTHRAGGITDTGTSGTASALGAELDGNTDTSSVSWASATVENRPQFLNCFYIMRVK